MDRLFWGHRQQYRARRRQERLLVHQVAWLVNNWRRKLPSWDDVKRELDPPRVLTPRERLERQVEFDRLVAEMGG